MSYPSPGIARNNRRFLGITSRLGKCFVETSVFIKLVGKLTWNLRSLWFDDWTEIRNNVSAHIYRQLVDNREHCDLRNFHSCVRPRYFKSVSCVASLVITEWPQPRSKIDLADFGQNFGDLADWKKVTSTSPSKNWPRATSHAPSRAPFMFMVLD